MSKAYSVRVAVITDDNTMTVHTIGTDFSPDADNSVTGAALEVLHDGTVMERLAIDGDEWRTLADSGLIDDVALCVRHGCSLSRAVFAAIECCNPEGFDADLLRELEAAEDEAAELRAQLEAVRTQLVWVLSWDVRNANEQTGTQLFVSPDLAVDQVIAWLDGDFGDLGSEAEVREAMHSGYVQIADDKSYTLSGEMPRTAIAA